MALRFFSESIFKGPTYWSLKPFQHSVSIRSDPIRCKCRVRLWRWRSADTHYVLEKFSVFRCYSTDACGWYPVHERFPLSSSRSFAFDHPGQCNGFQFILVLRRGRGLKFNFWDRGKRYCAERVELLLCPAAVPSDSVLSGRFGVSKLSRSFHSLLCRWRWCCVCVCVSGIYTIDVKYADMDITGSPFCTHVFDPSQVRVGHMPQGILGKPFKFDRK